MKRTEAGQGGRKGHSNMAHWSPTAIVKNEARHARRVNDLLAIDDGWDAEAMADCIAAENAAYRDEDR